MCVCLVFLLKWTPILFESSSGTIDVRVCMHACMYVCMSLFLSLSGLSAVVDAESFREFLRQDRHTCVFVCVCPSLWFYGEVNAESVREFLTYDHLYICITPAPKNSRKSRPSSLVWTIDAVVLHTYIHGYIVTYIHTLCLTHTCIHT